MAAAIHAFTSGEFTVVIDSVFDFEELPDAERRLESNDFFGKIVVLGPERSPSPTPIPE